MRWFMEARAALGKMLFKIRHVADHVRTERRMDKREPSEPSAEQVTFTHEEFTRNPSTVMRAAERSRVIVTDTQGQPSLAISRQLDELSTG